MNFVLLAMALTFGALNHGAIEMARAFIFSKPPGKRTVSQLCLNSFGSEFFSFFLQNQLRWWLTLLHLLDSSPIFGLPRFQLGS